jgi:hypothetical protein
MGDQVVVVHVGTDRIFELNTTAARIWDLVSDGRGRSEIQRLVSQEFDVPEMLAAAQIEELLDSLLSENIITAQVDEQSD